MRHIHYLRTTSYHRRGGVQRRLGVVPINIEETVRKWTRDVAQMRTRAVRAGLDRAKSQPAALSDVLRDALNTCVSLLQELAGAGVEYERLQRGLVEER